MIKKTSLIICAASMLFSLSAFAQAPVLMGTASAGGAGGNGTIFYLNTGGTTITQTTDVTGGTQGANPYGSIVKAVNGKFYGMTYNGGANSVGAIYEVGYTGPYTVKVSFASATNGSYPSGSLCMANDGFMYGLTRQGGANGYGCLIRYSPGAGVIAVMHHFNTADGVYPNGSLIQASDGKLYGLTSSGGTYGNGTIFSYDFNTFQYTKLHDFNSSTNGGGPKGSLMQAGNGKLYGMTFTGGASGYGTLFEYNIAVPTFTVLHNFSGTGTGAAPEGDLIEGTSGLLYGMTKAGGSYNYGTIFEFNISGGTTTNKYNFQNSTADGGQPQGTLIRSGYNNLFYGVTNTGGVGNVGVLFEFNPSGSIYTKKIDFNPTTGGSNPMYVKLIEYLPLDANISSSTNASCNGLCNGTATVSAGGGTPPYMYSWAPSGGTSATATGLCAGSYTCTITEAGGYQIQRMVTINQPSAITSVISSQTNVSCNGLSNGSATATAFGGVPAYSYNWAPIGGTASIASGLAAGNYTCTITDANGCTKLQPVTITEPTAISIGQSSVNSTCGMANGSATAIPSGGTPSYTYLWDASTGSQTTATANSLPAGNYTVTVTDAQGCTANTAIPINDIGGPTLSLSSTPVPCFGDCNGSANAAPVGGVGPYTYAWDAATGNQTSATANSLCAGIYTVTVTDANGCIVIDNISVTQPSVLTASSTQNNVSCNTGNNGNATVTPSGGTPSYSYNWLPGGATTATAINLAAGSYTCNITDANSCFTSYTVTITEPPAFYGANSSTDVSCNGGSDGTASNGPTGGVPPYAFLWTPSGQTTATATGLVAGTYSVTITDMNGCIINDFSTVNEPTLLSVSVNQTITGCAGTSSNVVSASPSGGTAPYIYFWSDASTGTSVSNIPSGIYYCTINDANGCSASDTTIATENTSTDIIGAITAPTLDISNGFVYAFKQQISTNGIDTVAIAPIVPGTPNSYTFSGLQADNYLIKVVPDAGTYTTAVPTYFGDEFQWDSSTVVVHGCSLADIVDIHVIELNGGTGTGFISGFVIEGTGFTGLRIKSGGNPNMPFAPGGPLKGVDIKLGKNPGGGIQARTTSDSTGYYDFKDIPDGDYTVYVDIPNLPMDSTRSVNISGADTSIQNNYYADSLMIFVDTTQSIGIYSSEKIYENKFSIYPNPSKGILNVFFTTEKESSLTTIEITNSLGQRVNTGKQEQYTKGDHVLSFDIQTMNMKAGIYFISIICDSKKYTQRLVVIE